MSSPSKAKGTAFEADSRAWWREALDQPQIERQVLHGRKDQGDLGGVMACGCQVGIIECKDCKDERLQDWREQTERERENSGADFAILQMHRAGCGEKRYGNNWCEMQLGDVLRVAGVACVYNDVYNSVRDTWVRMTSADAAALIWGGFEHE